MEKSLKKALRKENVRKHVPDRFRILTCQVRTYTYIRIRAGIIVYVLHVVYYTYYYGSRIHIRRAHVVDEVGRYTY